MKKILFVLIFAALSIAAYNINFSSLLGTENQSFTLFQFFAPTISAFLGPMGGIAGILIAEIGNYLLLGKAFDLFGIARLFPMLFAALYFAGKGRKFVSLVPIVCMALFVLHPVGQVAWIYSLYWLIPPIAALLKDNLFLRSLGSSFTAHAVGSVAFLYIFPTTPGLWISLIPVVFVERMLFASGISVSFIVFNSLLARIEHLLPEKLINVNERYVVR